MNELDWFQLGVIAFILVGIGVLVWRGGAANPVGTGRLQHDLSNVRATVNAIGGKVKHLEETAASKDNVEEVKSLLQDDQRRIETRQAERDGKIDRLDERLDGLEREVGKIQSTAATNHEVIESMAEGLRVTNELVQDIRAQVEATNRTTAQVPRFIEQVRGELSSATATIAELSKQVDRLYDFIVERGMSR